MRQETRSTGTFPLTWTAALCLTLAGCASTDASIGADTDTEPAMTHQHHRVDYIEFNVLDLAEAKRFYGDAFGWAFTDYGPEYAGIQKPEGGEVGGMLQVPEVARGGPLVILYSSDLEASVAAVQAAGGRVVKEPFEFPGGRRFQFLDPSGNELAVWSEQ